MNKVAAQGFEDWWLRLSAYHASEGVPTIGSGKHHKNLRMLPTVLDNFLYINTYGSYPMVFTKTK